MCEAWLYGVESGATGTADQTPSTSAGDSRPTARKVSAQGRSLKDITYLLLIAGLALAPFPGCHKFASPICFATQPSYQ
jgi:hypothetical protein